MTVFVGASSREPKSLENHGYVWLADLKTAPYVSLSCCPCQECLQSFPGLFCVLVPGTLWSSTTTSLVGLILVEARLRLCPYGQCCVKVAATNDRFDKVTLFFLAPCSCCFQEISVPASCDHGRHVVRAEHPVHVDVSEPTARGPSPTPANLSNLSASSDCNSSPPWQHGESGGALCYLLGWWLCPRVPVGLHRFASALNAPP